MERVKPRRSSIIFVGAILLALALWPVVERLADSLTAELGETKAVSGAKK